MNKLFTALALLLGTTSTFVQAANDGITVSNDPARVAAVQRHAEALKARQAGEQIAMHSASAEAHKQHKHLAKHHSPAARKAAHKGAKKA